MVGRWVAPGFGLPGGPMSARRVQQVICKRDGISLGRRSLDAERPPRGHRRGVLRPLGLGGSLTVVADQADAHARLDDEQRTLAVPCDEGCLAAIRRRRVSGCVRRVRREGRHVGLIIREVQKAGMRLVD